MPHARTSDQLRALTELISRAVDAEVDLLQIREPGLCARDVFALAEVAFETARGSPTRILVNDRPDIAACVGAGVHLATTSLSPGVVRATFGPEFLIGASTHSMEEARNAEQGGADFVVFGPVFETGSKLQYGPPVGLEALRRAASDSRIPVLALGGIDGRNFRSTLAAGAAGIAGISIFSDAGDLKRLVREIKSGAG